MLTSQLLSILLEHVYLAFKPQNRCTIGWWWSASTTQSEVLQTGRASAKADLATMNHSVGVQALVSVISIPRTAVVQIIEVRMRWQVYDRNLPLNLQGNVLKPAKHFATCNGTITLRTAIHITSYTPHAAYHPTQQSHPP